MSPGAYRLNVTVPVASLVRLVTVAVSLIEAFGKVAESLESVLIAGCRLTTTDDSLASLHAPATASNLVGFVGVKPAIDGRCPQRSA